jgi:hypothetical protein
MLLESIFVILLILVFVVIFYRAAIHEYTILQKDWSTAADEEVKWSELLGERAPLVVRNVPKQWTRLWTRARTAKFGWPVVLEERGKRVRTSWSTWLQSKPGAADKQHIMNEADLASAAGLYDQAVDAGLQFRRPLWLPGSIAMSRLTAHVIPPAEGNFVGLRKTTAEATCWVATDGTPLLFWIAHEGATKGGDYLPKNPYGRDPWTLKPEESPWISELKFMEIRLRPGHMFILPPHWWVALRCDANSAEPALNGSWFWTCEFHSAVSWVATRFHSS